MENQMEKLLHIPCVESEYYDMNLLPLFLKGTYHLKVFKIANISFLAMSPVERINLATMRKHRKKMMEITCMECAFQFEHVSAYTKNKMLEEGIPFILNNKELYLPFLGIAIANKKEEKIPPLQISFLTQKMLITILYKGIFNISVTEMAKILCVSKMSVTRSYDELDAFQLGLIEDKGKAGRRFCWHGTKLELWELIRPILRNPVIKEYNLDCIQPWTLPKSGMSAISHFSMLADDPYMTSAITKNEIKKLHLENLPQVPFGELPLTVIQVMGYIYLSEDTENLVIDPLSAVLSLSVDKLNDPRIEGAVQEIMEEIFDDRT